MPEDMEAQAQALNEADDFLKKAMRIYANENYSLLEVQDRVEELNDEEQLLAP